MKQIENQMNCIYKNYNRFDELSVINITDDCFTADIENVKKVVKLFEDRYPGFTYFIEARVRDLLNQDMLDIINNRQLLGMQIGVECGYDEGLKRIKKGLTVGELYRCLDLMHTKGLVEKAVFSFIIGFPWESVKDIEKTIETIEQLCRKYNMTASLNWFILLPSEIWDNKEKYGIMYNEEIYDNENWIIDKNIFFNIRHNISYKEFEYIENKVLKLQNEGLNIHHSKPKLLD